VAADQTLSGTPPISRSARQRLVEWANQQDAWVRAIVGEVISTRRDLSADSLAAIRDAYLVEKRLADGEAREASLLGDTNGNGDAAEPLRINELRDCTDVNALAGGQEIVFNPRMTVLFGENAAGKTGYVRVLKLLANVRGAQVIIPDIHRPSAGAAPEAVVKYSLGATAGELAWHGEKGVAPFPRITVFDSPAVALHLEENVTYVFTPADLALFGYVHAAIEGVRSLLQRDMTDRRPKQNPFLTAFSRGTDVYPRIEALSASTNVAELEGLSAVSHAEKTDLDSLKVNIEALSSPSSGNQAEMLRNRATVLRNLITLCEAFLAFDARAFGEAVNAEQSARASQAASAAAVFGGGLLPDAVRPAWQTFLEAGEEYLAASGQAAYPKQDDVCIYCHQALEEAARSLISSYREYAGGAMALAVRTAASEVNSLQSSIAAATVTAAIEGLRATLPGLAEGEQVPDWVGEGNSMLALVETLLEVVVDRKKPSPPAGTAVSDTLLARLTIALGEVETAIRALEGNVTERSKLLTEQRAKVAQIEARLRLAQLLPEIRAHVDQAAWADRLKTLLGRFQGLLTGLTSVSKLASEDVLNRDFERVFYDECKALRAPNVTLDFPGRRGHSARTKKVARDHTLADILSEGEQKVIAIADFLAETSLRSGSAPVVFDDPVNSFDYRRVREIAKRIAALSAEHQVIVFTHDIWFTSEVLSEFEHTPSECTYYQVIEDGGIKGIVSRASHPRLDTVASVRKRINSAIQDAVGGTDDDRQHRIDSAYSEVRTWCETVVETVLLNKVTQRHQPNVAMQNLSAIKVGHLQTAIDVIYPIWEKANRYTTAHSQPLGTLGVRPSISELKQDWADLHQALRQYEES
jgi:recombinational DNA repair ATPase RecF